MLFIHCFNEQKCPSSGDGDGGWRVAYPGEGFFNQGFRINFATFCWKITMQKKVTLYILKCNTLSIAISLNMFFEINEHKMIDGEYWCTELFCIALKKEKPIDFIYIV